MKRIILGILLSVVSLALFVIGIFISIDKNNDSTYNTNDFKLERKDNLLDIKNNYNTTVLVVKDTNIYKKIDNQYIKDGTIYKDSIIDLEEIDVLTKDNEYFNIVGTDYYINYLDITPHKRVDYGDYYDNYVSISKINTKDDIDLYYDNKPILHINDGMNFDVVINDTDMYYVKYLNRLVGIRKVDVKFTVNSDINSGDLAQNIPVLNYHFFYDLDSGEECNQSICLKKSIFDEHLKYLKDNGYNTLSVKDLDLWLDRKIELPAKSVLITVDDGAMGTDTHLIELLEKYDLRATLFLITSWWDKDKYKSHNLDIQSHGDNIHVERYCNGVSRGAKGLCLSKEELVKDFKKSINKLDGENTAFCYPFYLYNKNMLDAMKEVGFKLGFAGGDRKVKRTDDKYMLPRYIIYNYDDVNMLKNILK